jgi:lipopolysaccharide transport system permease protein
MVSGIMPTWRWLVIPALLLEILVLALAVGIWLAAASVRYRDVSQCLPFLTQLWMFATPVVYPGNLVPTRWQTLYMANPMVSISEHFRWAILNTNTNLSCNWFISVLVTLAVLIGGIVYFRHVERTMADYI